MPWSVLDLRRAALRLSIGLVLGLAAGFLAPAEWGAVVRMVCGWSVGATFMTGLSWIVIARSDSDETRVRAAAVDPGRTAVWD